MKSKFDKNNEVYNVEQLKRDMKSIPTELLDKFPEYKDIIKMINKMIDEKCEGKEIERRIVQSEEYLRLKSSKDEIEKIQGQLEEESY
jgi:hypothetical protein